MQWNVSADLAEADAMLRNVQENIASRGVEKVAVKTSQVLFKDAWESFSTKIDPMTGQPWAPAAPATVASPGFQSLMLRKKELRGALRSGYGLTPGGATAFLNVDASQIGLAMIHLYGVQAKKVRTYVRQTRRGPKQESRRRKRPGAMLPARGFAGISRAKLRELTDYTEQVMVE